MKTLEIKATVRWVKDSDIAGMARVEAESFMSPWSIDDFRACLGKNSCAACVVEIGGKVVGYLVMILLTRHIKMINMAVSAQWRRKGLATTMIDWVGAKMMAENGISMTADIRETNLAAQLFMRENGFTASKVLHTHYNDTDEDAYHFVKSLPQTPSSRKSRDR